jgi:folate-binding protein YgfZ
MPSLPAVTRSLDDQLDALDRGAGLFALGDGVIAIRGTDRVDWLSGMVTNEVKSLEVGASRYVALVHEKGKLLADGWAVRRANDRLLVVPRDTVDKLLEHFDRHIIMEDVEVARLDAEVATLVGARARGVIAPDGEHSFATERLARDGVDVVIDEARVAEIEAAVGRGDIVVVSAEAYAIARIEAGVPQWGVDFGPDNYVQEADITRRAVSFNKGCYCGQEVVCRLEMRGHVRRQLVGLRVPGEPVPRGTEFGEGAVVTSSARSRIAGESMAIAMVKWDVATSAETLDVAGRTARVVRLGA